MADRYVRHSCSCAKVTQATVTTDAGVLGARGALGRTGDSGPVWGPGFQRAAMYWIGVEDPPRRPGDTAAALCVLMDRVGPHEPFRLHVKYGYDFDKGVHFTRYEARPV